MIFESYGVKRRACGGLAAARRRRAKVKPQRNKIPVLKTKLKRERGVLETVKLSKLSEVQADTHSAKFGFLAVCFVMRGSRPQVGPTVQASLAGAGLAPTDSNCGPLCRIQQVLGVVPDHPRCG